MSEAKVSIIIPTFNMASTLERAVDSVLAQTHENIELIIVDDGSTDETANLVSRLKEENQELDLVYKKKENGGRGSALNTGFELVSGDYVALLDADDTLPNDSLRLRAQFLDENAQYGAVLGHYINITSEGRPYCKRKKPKSMARDYLRRKLLTGILTPFSQVGLLWRSDLLSDIGLHDPSLRRIEDLDFKLRLVNVTDIGCVDALVYEYRMDSHSRSSRLKNRIRSTRERLILIDRELSGVQKYVAKASAVVIAASKLSYDVFFPNLVYSLSDFASALNFHPKPETVIPEEYLTRTTSDN